MPKKRPMDEQIAFALTQADGATPVGEIRRKMGVSESEARANIGRKPRQAFFRWKKVYAGMGVAEIRRLKQLDDENGSSA